jgi:hypothetical protein
MTHGFKKDYIIVAEKLKIARAFLGADQWRGPRNKHLYDSAKTPDSNP